MEFTEALNFPFHYIKLKLSENLSPKYDKTTLDTYLYACNDGQNGVLCLPYVTFLH